MDLAEFYVAANPPLSPSGVAEVNERLQSLEIWQKGSICEVIYDSDAAWFRCLADPSVRSEINGFMESTFENLGEDTHIKDNQDQTSSNDDVDTSATGWFTNGWPIDKTKYPNSAYEVLRFPNFSKWDKPEPAFKASWHGAEQNWSLVNKDLFFGGNDLEEQFNVNLTWNLQRSVIYIASSHSMDDVNSTIAALDKMVETEKAQSQTRAETEARRHEEVNRTFVEPKEEFW